MDYMRYSRAVIVLEEKNREFADKPGTEMKGYLRVETGNNRGAIRCVMQNVKYFPRSEYTYQLILFGKKNEKMIHTVVGTIPVSRYGAGEVYLRFRPHDVDGQGHEYECYTTAIVAAVSSKNRGEALHPVLMGSTGHEAAKTVTVSAAEVRNPEVVNAAEIKEGIPRRTYNQYYAEYLKHVCQYFWNVNCHGNRTEPFGQDEEVILIQDGTRISWVKINDPSAMFLVSPGARYFAEQSGYFLLGKAGAEATDSEAAAAGNEENVTYYVAVPGRNCREDQPDGGESGFQLWKEGYWILGIDGRNGEIFSLGTR